MTGVHPVNDMFFSPCDVDSHDASCRGDVRAGSERDTWPVPFEGPLKKMRI